MRIIGCILWATWLMMIASVFCGHKVDVGGDIFGVSLLIAGAILIRK